MATNKREIFPGKEHDGMESDTLLKILEWAWLSLVAFVIHIYRKITGLETKAEVLERVDQHMAELRREDEERRKEQRKEIIDTITRHHETVMNKIEAIDRRIKNGSK